MEEESKKIILLADNEEDKNYLKSAFKQIKLYGYGDKGYLEDTRQVNLVYSHKLFKFEAKTVTTSKGNFIMFYLIKAVSVTVQKKLTGKVKFCTLMDYLFKKCVEYEICDAARITAIAYIYSEVQGKMAAYN